MDLKILTTQWPYRVLNGLGILVFILVIANIFLIKQNQSVRIEINERQQYINQSIRLSRLNTQLIQSLATTSAQTGDQELRGLLLAHGITYQTNRDVTDRK